MNKSELVAKIAGQTGLTKKDTTKFLEAFQDVVLLMYVSVLLVKDVIHKLTRLLIFLQAKYLLSKLVKL